MSQGENPLLASIVGLLRQTAIHKAIRRIGRKAGPRQTWETRWSNRTHAPVWLDRGISAELVEAVRTAWLSPEGPVLDLGCGEGDVTAWLAEQGYAATGVDIAQAAIDRAEKKHAGMKPGTFRQLDLTRDVLRQRFSSMVDRGCFHTIKPPSRYSYVANISSMARPGARLLLFVRLFGDEGLDPEEAYSGKLREVMDGFGEHFRIMQHRRTLGPVGPSCSKEFLPELVLWMEKA